MTAILLKGFLLGWSVAWPPGPINAEMIRRGLNRGFWAAWPLGLGACSGDFLWALAVALGAGALADVPAVKLALGVVSVVLLLWLAWSFGRGTHAAWRRRAQGLPPARPALDSTRGSYVLGLTLALSGPWNITFWLAVIGQQAAGQFGMAEALVMAAAVVAGAVTWTVVLCSAVAMGARFATPTWDIATQAATSGLMLWFAARTVLRLAADVPV